MAGVGPTSLDSKKSQQVKMEKMREEAQNEKERGNAFVKQEKWDEAIKCYNRAIELVKDDPIYYANRGLCYLKKESLHQAETDCTEALRLDPTYVKALQRRATARERLGSLRAATHDLNEVLKLEPSNNFARRQLEAIRTRMGTKGSKSKSSPVSTPTNERELLVAPSKHKPQSKIQDLVPTSRVPVVKPLSAEEKWRDGVGENITVIKTVKKPPHLRSKRPLKPIPIKEIELTVEPEKPPTRLQIVEVEEDLAQGDSKHKNSNIIKKEDNKRELKGDGDMKEKEDVITTSPESMKLITDMLCSEKEAKNMVPPVNSVQFMAEWKNLKGNDAARSDYLSIIEPNKIPFIFDNALESDVLSELITVIHDNVDKFKVKTITAYLRGLSGVKRFSALAMFLSSKEKELLQKLLEYCKTSENCTEEELTSLRNKYEL